MANAAGASGKQNESVEPEAPSRLSSTCVTGTPSHRALAGLSGVNHRRSTNRTRLFKPRRLEHIVERRKHRIASVYASAKTLGRSAKKGEHAHCDHSMRSRPPAGFDLSSV